MPSLLQLFIILTTTLTSYLRLKKRATCLLRNKWFHKLFLTFALNQLWLSFIDPLFQKQNQQVIPKIMSCKLVQVTNRYIIEYELLIKIIKYVEKLYESFSIICGDTNSHYIWENLQIVGMLMLIIPCEIVSIYLFTGVLKNNGEISSTGFWKILCVASDLDVPRLLTKETNVKNILALKN